VTGQCLCYHNIWNSQTFGRSIKGIDNTAQEIGMVINQEISK
jgi:hypothetical protein